MSKLIIFLKCSRFNVHSSKKFHTRTIPRTSLWYPETQTVDQLETGYARFCQSDSNSLLKKHLTKNVFEVLKTRRTSFNSTLLDCVQTGFTNLDSRIGAYAPDPESYTVFAELFDPIIEDIHGFSRQWTHPTKYFGNILDFKNVDPFHMYVLFTKIEVRRSLSNFPFSPALQIHQYNEIQNAITKVVCGLEREFKGKYYPLSAMDNEYVRYLKSCGYLFDENDKFLRAANALKGWPVGRGVFINDDKNFIVWVNEEDHMRLFSKEEGGNIQSVYQRLQKATNMINMRIKFARNKRLGFLTACPSNLDCVQSGFANLDSNIGTYAPDAEAYTVFAELFDRVIEEYHNGFTKCSVHPNIDFGNLDCFKNLDPEGKYVVSIRIRCGRSIHGYPFNPCLKEHQYREIEDIVTKALSMLQNELKGEYYPLCGMDAEFKKCLIDNHFLFKEGDRFLKAANATRFWPLGRGIFFNEDTTFLVWVNEEDHIRIISMQKGGDIHAVYARLVEGAKTIGTLLQFSRHKRLGYLTFCPTNLGNTCIFYSTRK